MQLVSLGSLSREEVRPLHREEAISMMQRIVAKRFKYRLQIDKECHPHIVCMAGPGTGKSRLADYGIEILKASPDEDVNRLANNNPLVVHISFNNIGTTFGPFDKDVGPLMAVVSRIFATYFGISLESVRNFSHCKSITLSKAFRVILAHHRKRHSMGPEQDVLIYLAIDDVSPIMSSLAKDEGRAFLESIFSDLAGMYTSGDHFFVDVVTGRSMTATAAILQRKCVNLPVPLLDLNQSLTLAEGAMKGTSMGEGENASWNCREMKLLLSDIGGIPRYVWEAIEEVIERKLTPGQDNEWRSLRGHIKATIKTRHQLLKGCRNEAELIEILRMAILRETVVPMDLWELENQGSLFFTKSGRRALVWLPIIHLECIAESLHPEINDCLRHLTDHSYTGWEMFNVAYDALLMTMHSRSGKRTVTVENYYEGAAVSADVADIELSLPDLNGRWEKHVKVVTLAR